MIRRIQGQQAVSSALGALGLPVDGHGAQYASLDAVYAFNDAPFVALETDDPVADTQDLYIPAHAFGQTGRELVDELAQFADGLARVILRVEATSRLEPAEPFRPMARYVHRRCTPSTGTSAVDIRPVDTTSEPFVRSLLRRAIFDGYGATELVTEDVDGYVNGLKFGPPNGLSALVARHEGRDIGHITWTAPLMDDVTGDTVVDLVDVLVLPEFEARGITAALTEAVLDALSRDGATLRGNVIAAEDGSDARLYSMLLNAGWSPAFDLWVAPL